MKIICFFVLIIFLSCTTMKWKEKYARKKLVEIQEHYIRGSGFTIGGIPSELFKPTKEATRKEFKKKINYVEKLFTIVPDSVAIHSDRVDSIYLNKYKISFLKKNQLKTKAMIFIE